MKAMCFGNAGDMFHDFERNAREGHVAEVDSKMKLMVYVFPEVGKFGSECAHQLSMLSAFSAGRVSLILEPYKKLDWKPCDELKFPADFAPGTTFEDDTRPMYPHETRQKRAPMLTHSGRSWKEVVTMATGPSMWTPML
jgi:hypothetical protein